MSKQSKMTGADYLLLLLYLDNCSAINGAIRITKMMFLFNMEIVPVLKKKGVSICDEDLPKFSAYNYGPFSKDVYEQVELFQSIGFIKVKNLYATEEMSEVDDWEESAFETEFSEGSCQYSSNQDGKFMQYKLLNLGKKYVESEIIPQLTNDQLSNGVGLIFYDTELNEFFIEVEASKTADVWEKERCRIVNYLEAKRDEATTSKNSQI